MKYISKTIAIVLMLTMSSLSFAQGVQLDNENQAEPKHSTALKAAVVVVGAVITAFGGYKLIKYIDKRAAQKTAQAAEQAKQLAEEARQARKELKRTTRQAERKKARQHERRTERKAARQAERQRIREEKAEAAARKAEQIRTVEASTAAIVEKHAEVIERGKLLQQAARDGKKMSVAELRTIYEGGLASLEIEKAKKLEIIHKEHPDLYSAEEMAAAVQRRDEEIDQAYEHRKQISDNFKAKYPQYVAIEELEKEYQQSIKHWDEVYGVAKNLTDGIPTVKYAPEFTDKISAIIDTTPLAEELSTLVRFGNLQEVIWRLDEQSYASEAAEMTKLIEDVLTSGKIINQDTESLRIGSTKPLLLEFSNGLKGVFKGDNGQYDEWRRWYDWPQREIAAYRFDQLLDLRIFPITVPRQLDNHPGGGSVQLFIDGAAGSEFRQQYVSYFELIGKDLPSNDGVEQLAAQKNQTFFTLTMDRDYDAYFSNSIKPLTGRLIKIDAEQAFYTGYPTAGKDLLSRPDDFYIASDFITRLDSITVEQLEEIFQPLFAAEKADDIVKDLHNNIRSYVDAARQI